MKATSNFLAFGQSPRLATMSAAVALALCFPHAGATDLADVPLANSTTLAVPPNIAMVIDDSGSMDDDNIPGSANTNNTKYCFRWYGYNGVAYNPNFTYRAPVTASGARLPDADFSAAPDDGYFPVDGTATMYDSGVINTHVNLNYYVTSYSKISFPDFASTAYRATSVLVTRPDNSTFELLNSTPVPAAGTTVEDTVGAAIASSINAKTATSHCFATYDTANSGGWYGTLRITCPTSLVKSGTSPAITLQNTNAGAAKSLSIGAFGSLNHSYYATHKTDATRTVCDADTSYNIVTTAANIAAPDAANGSTAALTNFANWYSYYRKRAYMMKASVAEAFSKLADGKFRVGYFTIDSADSEVEIADGSPINRDLKIDLFTGTTSATHRGAWFDKVFSTKMAGYTPLRGALSRMGRMYSGKISGWDPVQYSCQRNYTLLTTDGYWNTNAEVSSGTAKYGPYKEDNATLVGDQDGSATLPEKDHLAASNTLADVAYYYYHNDLRTSAKGNCTVTRPGSPPTTGNVCSDDVPGSLTDDGESDFATFQHMTTYTLGLGVTGNLVYDSNYKSQTSAAPGDFYRLKTNTANTLSTCGTAGSLACRWPTPAADSSTAVDDLWHAAVNGRGLYLSAKNPSDLATALATALNSMQAVTGAGAGAAAANLAPTSGISEIYVAQYKTDEWYGDVLAYNFDATTGVVSAIPTWSVGALLDARIGVGGNSDTRTIYATVDGVRKDFTWTNLNAQQKAYFDNTKLSQYSEWTGTQLTTTTTGEPLVNYLRGRYVNEEQTGTTVRLYRNRTHVLGDIVHSQPVYVKVSNNSFVPDRSYGGRMGMLYVAANDGMLHAFCTETSGSCTPGKELWAYVVPPAMKNMWYLADRLYIGNHRFLVDGPIAVTDVEIDGAWRTILIGGLGAGGRAYYALDITDPTDPKPLWNFAAEGLDDKASTTDDNNANLGYSYGLPLVTKVGGGAWSVLLTSGYNNVPNKPNTGDFPTADGKGYIFMLDPKSGDQQAGSPITTGATSELAQVQIHVPNLSSNNSASMAYGGDLAGDMWRFDLVAKTATKVISTGSPITTGPDVSTVEGYTVLFFGTGRYLGTPDITDPTPNYIVAVKADKSNLGLDTGTSKMVDMTDQTGSMDWQTKNGWFRKLGDKERVHIDVNVYLGRLIVGTVIPEGNECKPGGTGNLYVIDILTGLGDPIYFADPPMGFTVIDPEPPTGPDPKPRMLVVDSKGKAESGGVLDLPPSPTGKKGTRIMWRELID